MKKNALYEVEIQRSNVTPRRFFGICKREVERRTGYQARLTDWIENPEIWGEPLNGGYDTKTPEEICKSKPYEWQYYLRGGYNFIFEFNFYDDKTGCGYLYLVEFER